MLVGYLNKTCATNTGPASYGPAVGPILRDSKGERWALWTFTRKGQSPKGDDLLTIQTFYPRGRGQPL